MMHRSGVGAVALAVALMVSSAPGAGQLNDEATRQRQMESMRQEAVRADQAGAERARVQQQATANAARGANAPSSGGGTVSPGSSGGASGLGASGGYTDRGPGSVVARYTLVIARRETPAQMIARLTQGAAAGEAEAQYNLGRVFYTGFNAAPRDDVRARDYFRQAATAGYAPAQANYGYFLDRGIGGPADQAAAVGWLRKAADAGNSFGQALYGLHLSTNAQDQGRAALPYLTAAADAGELTAQAMLGFMYVVGQSSYHDDAKGARYLRLAADAGDAASTSMLAGLMLSGRAGTKVEGYALMKKAAEAGDQDARYNYGLMLLKGEGFARDPILAESIVRRAAVAGSAKAMSLLGDLYNDKVNGLEESVPDAVYWYGKAAAAGDADGIRMMAAVRQQNIATDRAPAHGTGAVATPPPTAAAPTAAASTAAPATATAPGFVACMSMQDLPTQNYFFAVTKAPQTAAAGMQTGFPRFLRSRPALRGLLSQRGGDPPGVNLNTTCEWYADRAAAEARTESVWEYLRPRGFSKVPMFFSDDFRLRGRGRTGNLLSAAAVDRGHQQERSARFPWP